jgi:hypothetical protein
VKSRTEWSIACLSSVGVVLLTLGPYIMAARLVPEGRLFSGFLVNPVDGFSYLSKMHQGLDGAWVFRLPYAGASSSSAAIFLFYLALGHLAGWVHVPLLTVYHIARMLGGCLMFMAVFDFLWVAVPNRRSRWVAFAFILFGSGLGWLGLAAGLQGTDLLVPESIPFVTAFTNPHFPLAVAMVAFGGRLVIGRGRWMARSAGALGVGAGLGIVLPFAAAPLVAVSVVWVVWEGLRSGHAWAEWLDPETLPGLFPALGLGMGALPWLAYDYLVVSSRPIFAAWNAQNVTPSPPIWDYALGFGVVLVGAVVAVSRAGILESRRGRFLITWAIVNSLLLYLPFNLQRRFSLGLFVPLAALAGMGLIDWQATSQRRARPVLALALLLSLPSNGLVIAAGVSTAASGSPVITETVGEVQAYEWLNLHAAPGSVVLAAQETGVRLPAYAPVVVIVGHPYETPDAGARAQQVTSLFDGGFSPEASRGLLKDWQVAYVFYGPRERSPGPAPEWLSGLRAVFAAKDVTIYAVETS